MEYRTFREMCFMAFMGCYMLGLGNTAVVFHVSYGTVNSYIQSVTFETFATFQKFHTCLCKEATLTCSVQLTQRPPSRTVTQNTQVESSMASAQKVFQYYLYTCEVSETNNKLVCSKVQNTGGTCVASDLIISYRLPAVASCNKRCIGIRWRAKESLKFNGNETKYYETCNTCSKILTSGTGESTSETGDDNVGIIVGVIISVLLVLLIIFIVIVVVRRRRGSPGSDAAENTYVNTAVVRDDVAEGNAYTDLPSRAEYSGLDLDTSNANSGPAHTYATLTSNTAEKDHQNDLSYEEPSGEVYHNGDNVYDDVLANEGIPGPEVSVNGNHIYSNSR